MELDWSTFVLEIINFLILVWLLKRFLYQPVLNVITLRREKIEHELAQTAQGKAEVEGLRRQYETRLSDWEQEKRQALDALEQAIGQERSKRMQQLDAELEQQRLKEQTRDEQQRSQWRNQAEAEALQLGGAFASRLLKSLSCSELDLRLQQLFIDQLLALPESAVRQMRAGWQESAAKVEIISAMELDESRQQLIRAMLEQKLGPRPGSMHFRRDEHLIAGLRVSIGGWLLQANLQDELRFFSEAAVSHD